MLLDEIILSHPHLALSSAEPWCFTCSSVAPWNLACAAWGRRPRGPGQGRSRLPSCRWLRVCTRAANCQLPDAGRPPVGSTRHGKRQGSSPQEPCSEDPALGVLGTHPSGAGCLWKSREVGKDESTWWNSSQRLRRRVSSQWLWRPRPPLLLRAACAILGLWFQVNFRDFSPVLWEMLRALWWGVH